MNKKVGLIVEYYDFRSDIRETIKSLSSKVDLVLFITKEDEEQIKKLGIEYRIIDRTESYKNKILKSVFKSFHRKHHLKYDLVSWRLRKIGSKLKFKQLLQIIYFNLLERIPGFLTYDFLLKYLDTSDNVSDLDSIISLTELKYDELLSSCYKNKVNIFAYVYSWDHPIKLKKMSSNKINYLVWNKYLKEDLCLLHKINPKNIFILGSTQLSYIYDFLFSYNIKSNDMEYKYIYYASTFARYETVLQEIELVKYISSYLLANDIDIKILFRPYPNVENSVNELYDSLISLGNVELDIYKDDDYIFTQNKIYSKFEKIQNSVFTIHTGSTFGMEACYFDVPNIFFTFKKSTFGSQSYAPFYLDLKNIINQYHLNKYLKLDNYKNIVRTEKEFEKVLEEILINKDTNSYLEYNEEVRKYTPLLNIETLVDNILNIIKKGD